MLHKKTLQIPQNIIYFLPQSGAVWWRVARLATMVAVGVQTKVSVHSLRYTAVLCCMFVPHFSVYCCTVLYVCASFQCLNVSMCVQLELWCRDSTSQSATTIAATSVVLPVATILLTSLSGVNVCTVFFLVSWELGNVALKNGSVHGLATKHCCQLEINSGKSAFHIQYI